jgi:hypothetical protein
MTGDTDRVVRYENDSHGRMTKAEGPSFMFDRTVILYDSAGRKTGDSCFIANNELYGVEAYVYDDKGNRIHEEGVNNITHGVGRHWRRDYRYDFDANGNWIKKYIDKAHIPSEIREIKYYP